MKLMNDDETLIPLLKADGMLGLDPSTLPQRKAGTGSLTGCDYTVLSALSDAALGILRRTGRVRP